MAEFSNPQPLGEPLAQFVPYMTESLQYVLCPLVVFDYTAKFDYVPLSLIMNIAITTSSSNMG